ncbi:MAG: SpoIID/LytB domain-containing protein [Candidatus Eisenbacteria bacterium]
MRFGLLVRLLGLAVLLVLPGCAAVKPPIEARREIPRIRVGLEVGAEAVTVSGTGMLQIAIKDSPRKPKMCGPGEKWTFIASSSPELGNGLEVIDPDGLSRGVMDAVFVVAVVEAESFLTLGGRRYRGSFEVFRDSSGKLTLVNVLNVESYLRGVVPNEIGSSSPETMEAVKAQAVAARTYTFFFAGRYATKGFDALPTVQDQVYTGVDGERPLSDRAIAETYGVVLTYRGKPIRTNYFSTCGGATAAIEEVWPFDPLPYLKSVSDRRGLRGEGYCSESSNYRWTEVWTVEQFEAIFRKYYSTQYATAVQPRVGERIVNVKIAERSGSGRVRKLEIVTTDNVYRLTGDAIRLVIRRPNPEGAILRSTLFDVDVQREGGYARTIIFSGGGNGHGVGMCQMGAIGMARRGKRVHEILTYYYRGVKLSRAY